MSDAFWVAFFAFGTVVFQAFLAMMERKRTAKEAVVATAKAVETITQKPWYNGNPPDSKDAKKTPVA